MVKIRNILPEELGPLGLNNSHLVKDSDPIAHLQNNLIRRQFYTVSHVIVKLTADALWRDLCSRELRAIPVFPHFHNDPQFSPAPKHYHHDGRFTYEKSFELDNGRTNSAIFETQQVKTFFFGETYTILDLIYIRKRCVRLSTGLDLTGLKPDNDFDKWYNSMIGKSCAGKKCPHYGTPMIDHGDHLQCPMHNLIGSKEDEVIISREMILRV